MNGLTIAIDGYVATGKSTLAKMLAQHFGYTYVDSGAMYRAVTLYALQQGWLDSTGISNRNALLNGLPQITIHFQKVGVVQHTFLNGKDVEAAIRSPKVSQSVSEISVLPEVRTALVAQQQAMESNNGMVMDGRDIGTVVFPHADCKFFLTAKPKIRAKRRLLELQSRGIDTTLEAVLDNVNKRDQLDSSRTLSPLKKAEDAITIDVSNLDLDTVFQKMLDAVNRKIKGG